MQGWRWSDVHPNPLSAENGKKSPIFKVEPSFEILLMPRQGNLKLDLIGSIRKQISSQLV